MRPNFGPAKRVGHLLAAASQGVETEFYNKETHWENGTWTRETRLYVKVGGLGWGNRPAADADYVVDEDGTADWELFGEGKDHRLA